MSRNPTGLCLGRTLACHGPKEPLKAPSPTEFLAIGTANANSGPTARGVAADEETHFLRLKQIPIKAQ